MLGAKGLEVSNFKDLLFQSTKLNSKEIVIVDQQFQNGSRRCIIYVCFGLQGACHVPFRAHALGFYSIKCSQQRKIFLYFNLYVSYDMFKSPSSIDFISNHDSPTYPDSQLDNFDHHSCGLVWGWQTNTKKICALFKII